MCTTMKNTNTVAVSHYNADNKIYTDSSRFLYQVMQIDSAKRKSFYLLLTVLPGDYNNSTQIEYKYYYDFSFSNIDTLNYIQEIIKKGKYRWEITSVIDDSNIMQLHPPRSYTLGDIMETAPFPTIKFPVFKNMQWTSGLWVGPGWGKLSFSTIKWKYVVDSILMQSNDTLYSIKSKSFGKKEHLLCDFDMVFSKKRGFINMDYSFSDNSKVKIKMVSCSLKR